MSFVKVIGVGSYTPDNIVSNDDLSNLVDTSDEWISSRTGVKNRRICTNQDASDLAIEASKFALESAGICGDDIELIVLSTTSTDSFIPSMACKVQKAIGATKAASFDISAACSGLVYALSIAKSMMMVNGYKKALIIGAEALSKIVDWSDRNTCVLFGDGAAAMILEDSDVDGVPYVEIGTDPFKYEVLTCEGIPLNNAFIDEDKKKTEMGKIYMNGREVFKFAVNVLEKSIRYILNKYNLTMNDIDHVVCHQANFRIIESACKKLGEGDCTNKFFMNLKEYGNTSSASIGIALDEMDKKNLLKKGEKIILVGFGGGLTYGSALINWTK